MPRPSERACALPSPLALFGVIALLAIPAIRYGAVDVPLAWPLRYSHSPAELIDLRDVRSLASLVRAAILAP